MLFNSLVFFVFVFYSFVSAFFSFLIYKFFICQCFLIFVHIFFIYLSVLFNALFLYNFNTIILFHKYFKKENIMSLILLLLTWLTVFNKPLKAVCNRDCTASKPFTIVKSLHLDLKRLSAFICCLHAVSFPRLPGGVLNAQIPSTSSYRGDSEPPTCMTVNELL